MGKPKSITIIGRRWFQKSYGNTYCTATIIVDGKEVHRTEKEYGYGDYYEQVAWAWLDTQGLAPPREKYEWGGSEAPFRYCDANGIEYHREAFDVPRERDL